MEVTRGYSYGISSSKQSEGIKVKDREPMALAVRVSQ